MKTRLSILAGVVLSATLLYFAFRNVDFGKLLEIYKKVNPWFIVPFVITGLAELFFRGLRWKLLLDPAGPVRVWDAFRLETAGLALNNILPMRLGEIVRGTFGAKFFSIPMVTVFATILVERALDVIVLFMIFAAAAKIGGITGGFLNYGAYLWALLIMLAAALGALIFIDEIMAHHFFSGFFGRFPRVKKVLESLALGVRAFHSFRTAAAIIACAAMQWLMDALNFYWMACAFGIGDVIDIYKGVALVFTGCVAASVPGMPGYFGNFEFTISRVTSAWGVPAEVGFAYASYVHILGYLLVTIIGLIFVYQMGHSLSKLWAQFGAVGAKRTE